MSRLLPIVGALLVLASSDAVAGSRSSLSDDLPTEITSQPSAISLADFVTIMRAVRPHAVFELAVKDHNTVEVHLSPLSEGASVIFRRVRGRWHKDLQH